MVTQRMIALIDSKIRTRWLALLGTACAALPGLGADTAGSGNPGASIVPMLCLSSGDGYLRARLAGAIDTEIDWPNSGTRCAGEARRNPVGVRLSFERPGGANPDLLFVFGITGVRAGEAAHALGVNLTVIVQGTSEIFGTLGDARCTIDSLAQRPLAAPDTYRVEARGFCTQPAHAVRGSGDLLVNRFDFAGIVNYPRDDVAD